MKIFAFIFARGGSKGLPRKNIRNLGGKPLLAHSITLAQSINQISRVFVSTDDKDIADIGLKYGAEIIKRPPELSQDDSPEWLAWLHAIEWLEERGDFFDYFVSLPTTSPLRNEADVTNCIDMLGEDTDIVITVTNSSRSPYFNMVKELGGYVKLAMTNDNSYIRRQDVPKIFDMTTVAYVSRPNFIKNNRNIFNGRVKSVLIPKERAIDIDDEIDFKISEILLKERIGDKK